MRSTCARAEKKRVSHDNEEANCARKDLAATEDDDEARGARASAERG